MAFLGRTARPTIALNGHRHLWGTAQLPVRSSRILASTLHSQLLTDSPNPIASAAALSDNQNSEPAAAAAPALELAIPVATTSTAEEPQLDERELLRRQRISAANTGKVPWNKGRQHSQGKPSARLTPHASPMPHKLQLIDGSSPVTCAHPAMRNPSPTPEFPCTFTPCCSLLSTQRR